MDGIINLCKPRGMSSLQAVGVVKRKLTLNKVGHLGTLDPAACGVLVLLCGRATKLTERLHGGAKVYRTLITWGTETDTLDATGQVVATSSVIPTVEQIEKTLTGMTGSITITVPKYSAVHINGARAYALARRGVNFVPPQKTVQVSRFVLLPTAECEHDLHAIGEDFVLPVNSNYFEIECEVGTYVRSLAQLLATRLGTVATATVILRTRVGQFDLHTAKTLDCVQLSDLQSMEEICYGSFWPGG